MGENRTLEFGEKENMNNMEERSNNSSEESGTINKVMTIPNIMSICRIVLIVPFIICFLNEKYIVFKTPLNYNTSYGLIRTINQYIDKYNDYFIAEMGTLKKNDIKTEASIVKPKYGILTTIGTAHLDSFKTIENIAKEKFDLIESLPSDGIAILNKDDKIQVNYQINNNCKIMLSIKK